MFAAPSPGAQSHPTPASSKAMSPRCGAEEIDEADRLAARWRAASPRFEIVYLRSQLAALRAPGVGKRDAGAICRDRAESTDRSADAALSLGWLSYETKDFARALTWFRKAADWGGDAKAKEASPCRCARSTAC